MHVLIFKTCPSMTLYVLLLAYTPNSSFIDSLEVSKLVLS
jgi:hypothetical protein